MRFLDIKPYPTGILVSRNHTLLEFIYDERAVANLFYMQFVYQPEIVDSIQFLCKTLIDPLECKLGVKFEIISGYRCSGLNTITAEENSLLHLHGLAIDIQYFPGIHDLIDQVFRMQFHEMFLYNDHIHLSVKYQFNNGRFEDRRIK